MQTPEESIIVATATATMSRRIGEGKVSSCGAILSTLLCASAGPDHAPSTSREAAILSTILAVLKRYAMQVGLFFFSFFLVGWGWVTFAKVFNLLFRS